MPKLFLAFTSSSFGRLSVHAMKVTWLILVKTITFISGFLFNQIVMWGSIGSVCLSESIFVHLSSQLLEFAQSHALQCHRPPNANTLSKKYLETLWLQQKASRLLRWATVLLSILSPEDRLHCSQWQPSACWWELIAPSSTNGTTVCVCV